MKPVICPYCECFAEIQLGKKVYPHRPDLAGKRFWMCEPCGAYVGCHPNSARPLGRLANAELRAAKMRAHSIFDPLWRNGSRNRTEAYQWLAGKLGIKVKHCHIGMFDIETCRKVIDVCHEEMQEF